MITGSIDSAIFFFYLDAARPPHLFLTVITVHGLCTCVYVRGDTRMCVCVFVYSRGTRVASNSVDEETRRIPPPRGAAFQKIGMHVATRYTRMHHVPPETCLFFDALQTSTRDFLACDALLRSSSRLFRERSSIELFLFVCLSS